MELLRPRALTDVIACVEFLVDVILDRDRAEIGILAVEAALGRLVGVLEPVIADERSAFAEPAVDVMPEAGRPLGLGRDQRSGAVGVGQAGIGAAKGELADQAGLAGSRIGVDRRARIRIVAIERDDIDMARRRPRSRRAAERRRSGSPSTR